MNKQTNKEERKGKIERTETVAVFNYSLILFFFLLFFFFFCPLRHGRGGFIITAALSCSQRAATLR